MTPAEQAEVERMIDAYSRLEDYELAEAAMAVISDIFDGKPPDLRLNALAALYAIWQE